MGNRIRVFASLHAVGAPDIRRGRHPGLSLEQSSSGWRGIMPLNDRLGPANCWAGGASDATVPGRRRWQTPRDLGAARMRP